MTRQNDAKPMPMSALSETGSATLPSGERGTVLAVQRAGSSGGIARLFAGFGPRIVLAPEGSEGGGAAETGTEGQGQSSAEKQGGGSETATTLTRPDGIPDQFWDDKDGVKYGDLVTHLNELTAFKASADSRTAAVPEKPEGYELKLPEGIELPEGVTFEINQDDPMFTFGREVAHAMGLDQSGFEKMVGLYALRAVNEAKELDAAKARQIEALGPKGQDRQNAVKTFLSAKLGPDALTVFEPVLMLKTGVETLEKLMRVASGGGAPGFTNTGRMPGGNTVTDEEYQAMSPAQRLVHARKAQGAGR